MAARNARDHVRNFLIYSCSFLQIVWVVLFLYLIWAGPFQKDISWLDRALLAAGCETCVAAGDSIQSAYEMGRLEIVSLSLTVLGTVIAVGAFFGFFMVRAAAMSAATDEVIVQIDRKLPQILKNEDIIQAILQDERIILTLATEVLRRGDDITAEDAGSSTDGDAANRIAEAIDEQ